MTNEEKQALIKDCKNDIVGIKHDLDEYGDDGYAQIHLESKLRRQEIALASLTTPAVSLAQVSNCLSFFSSVIKSGESWSDTCQRELDLARETLRNIEEANK